MWDICQYFGTFIAFYYSDSLPFFIMNSFKKQKSICDKGIIDVFEMKEAIILLRKKYKMSVISIYGNRSNNSSD